MQRIERVGVVALLFLVVTIVVVAFWDDTQREADSRAAKSDARSIPTVEERALSAAPKKAQGDGRTEAQSARDRLTVPLARGEERGTPIGDRDLGATRPAPARRGADDTVPAQAERGAERARTARALELDLPRRTNPAEEEALLRAGLASAPEAAAVLASPSALEPRVEPASRKEKPKAPPAPPVTYEVQPGDSLARIARKMLGDEGRAGEIAALNKIRDPHRIQVGAKLVLPGEADLLLEPQTARAAAAAPATSPAAQAGPAKAAPSSSGAGKTTAGREYVVKKGETLSLIAQRELGHAKLWPKIAAANPALNPDRVVAGTRLILPEASLAEAAPKPATSAKKPVRPNAEKVASAAGESRYRVR